MFKSPLILTLVGGMSLAANAALAQSAEDQTPAYLWQSTTLDNPGVPGGKTALFAYVETATSRPLVTGICKSDGETTLAEVTLAAEINKPQDARVDVEFAVFGDNKFEGQVQRAEGQPATVQIRVPLESSLLTSLRQQTHSAYRIEGKVENLELRGSSAALTAFTADCRAVKQAFARLQATYATCQTLRPRSRSPIRKKATIVNNSGNLRVIRRLTSSGGLIGSIRLEPGQRTRIETRVNAIYQFDDEAGNCIQRQRVRSSSSTIVLTAPDKLEL